MLTDARTEPAARKPKRRWRQYSVSSLLLLITATALSSSGAQSGLQAAERSSHEERLSKQEYEARRVAVTRAIQEVDAARGTWHCERPTIKNDAGAEQPADLAETTGFRVDECTLRTDAIEGIGRLTWIKELSFHECSFKPDTLNALGGMRQLECVKFWDTKVTPTQLSFLKELPHLSKFTSVLEYEFTEFSDECLQQIPMKELTELDIPGSSITDAGLAPLSAATELESLDLSGTKVKGPGLRHLADLPKLEYIGLAFTRINDQRLRDIGALKSLKRLDLQNEQLTDAGIAHLEPMLQLEALNIAWCRITDAAVPSLSKLKGLKQLVLVDYIHIHGASEDEWSPKRVSNEGVARLRAALPDCTITAQRWGSR